MYRTGNRILGDADLWSKHPRSKVTVDTLCGDNEFPIRQRIDQPNVRLVFGHSFLTVHQQEKHVVLRFEILERRVITRCKFSDRLNFLHRIGRKVEYKTAAVKRYA